ncbi:MAG: shikimate dehydrogenase [Dehalococcoidia bacterium]|nr:shikimate dehydrogenase [Dehalococcoidia bacterium]
MSKSVGIIGYPLSHTISPVFQQAALDHEKLDARYQAWETPAKDLTKRIELLRAKDCMGANVTVPHKEAVLQLVDELDMPARYIGAVNTIVNNNGKLKGYNTDWGGFLRSLKDDAGFIGKGKTACVLGAGGSSRAICYALGWEGVSRLIITNRTQARAEDLAKELRGVCKRVDVLPWSDALPKVELIVNCTTVGLLHSTQEQESPIDTKRLSAATLVMDLIYNPQQTPLLKGAKQAGCRTLNGLAMLVYQGAGAFELWTGKQAPVDVMMRAAKNALR